MVVVNVFPGGSLDKAGLVAGDVITHVDGAELNTTRDAVATPRRYKAGDAVELRVLRNKKQTEVPLTFTQMPMEQSSEFDISYETLIVNGARRRTIITRPRGTGKHPAVLMVGGIGCYSLDQPFGSKHPYLRILYSLTSKGFVTMRVEKSGMGDSEGTPCAQQDFRSELVGYVEAAKALKRLPYVDSDQVYVFGHSMGGIHGPLVARKIPLRGVIALATAGTRWIDYEITNTRRQRSLRGIAGEELEKQVQQKEDCTTALLLEKKSREDVLKSAPSCAEWTEYPAHDTYMQQLAELDILGNWKHVNAPVLIIYGKADYVVSAEEHEAIAAFVNKLRPGTATLIAMQDLDHFFNRVASQTESMKAFSEGKELPFNTDVTDVIEGWLAKQTNAGNASAGAMSSGAVYWL